jgi:sugar phosphate isomerase/epimerase
MPDTPPAPDRSRLAIHTMTHKPWSLRDCCEQFEQAGVPGVSVWRNVIDPAEGGCGLEEAVRLVKAHGLTVPALVRGGFFVSADPRKRDEALDVNRQCIDEAQALGAAMVVLVVGAEPGVPLDAARQQVADGIGQLLDHARQADVVLAIEPLHPMYAGDKSCINRMAEARQVCEQLGHDPHVGIAVDVYHVWWDPDLPREIQLAGQQGNLTAFHVCDWRLPTRDLLTDRALMGDGCIDIPGIRAMVESAGFDGPIEVEIFSEQHWTEDQADYLRRIIERYDTAV